MKKLISFTNADGADLFSAPVEVVPRVGDIVRYSFEATDRAEWNAESWFDYSSLGGKEWRVESVHHDFRRMNIRRTAHVVFVCVSEGTTT